MVKVKQTLESILIGAICFGPTLYLNWIYADITLAYYGMTGYVVLIATTNLVSFTLQITYFKLRRPARVREQMIYSMRKRTLAEFEEIKNSLKINGYWHYPTYVRFMMTLTAIEFAIIEYTDRMLMDEFNRIKSTTSTIEAYLHMGTKSPTNIKMNELLQLDLEHKIDDLTTLLNKLKPGVLK